PGGRHRRRRRRRVRARRHDLDRARPLEPAERRVEGAVRDAPEEAEGVAEALLQLVAVQRLLLEEAEDGEFEHALTPSNWLGYIDSIYRTHSIDRKSTRLN